MKRPGEFDQPLSYRVPEQIAQQCQRGQGVLVELKDKEVRGIIVGLDKNLPEGIDKIKDVDGILPELSLLEVQLDAAQRIADYYHCSLLRAIKLFVPSTLWQGKGKRTLKQVDEADFKEPEASNFPFTPLKHDLSNEQEEALRVISSSKKGILLHGVTGSGKTEVYLRLILESVRRGKQAILLVPEIALTPQTINYFQEYFGDHLAVFHSKLSDGERLKEWFKVKKGFARLVIGSRLL
ncbi:MAG: DEAD/DEAH box helicase, partial [Candidatus Peregrinibacteria bacterium]|nr:DEAD/DEAH box helicase [Candidatus Peregrinibacteria bacterium]